MSFWKFENGKWNGKGNDNDDDKQENKSICLVLHCIKLISASYYSFNGSKSCSELTVRDKECQLRKYTSRKNQYLFIYLYICVFSSYSFVRRHLLFVLGMLHRFNSI